MRQRKKFALMFMTSFIGSVLVLVLFVVYVLQGSVFERALEKSDYAALVHQELLGSAAQSVSAYGLRSDVMDVVLTQERVEENIVRNLSGLEVLDLKLEMMDVLHQEIDRMGITFTQDVEKGMLELSDKLMGNFKQRTRFPLQGTIMGLLQRVMPYVWGIMILLVGLFIVFVLRLRVLTLRERNTVYQSILGTWLILLLIFSLIDLKALVFEPASLKVLIMAMHLNIGVDALMLLGLLVIVYGLSIVIMKKRLTN